MSGSLRPHRLCSPWNSLGQNIGVGSLSLGDLPNPGIETRSTTLQADSLPAEPQGKPKKTGVGSLSLLQWIFPTQESNRGPLHCRQILCQPSYQGIPKVKVKVTQWCLTLREPMDCIGEFSSVQSLSRVRLFATP